MTSEWSVVTLAEVAAKSPNSIAAGPFGSNLGRKDYVPDGVPVIRGQNLSTRWVSGEFVYVSGAKAEELVRNQARPGDIVFTQRGTLGQVAMVPPRPFERYVLSQSQMKLTVDEEIADPYFVYYACRSPQFVRQIMDTAIVTGVPHINLGILRSLQIPLPPRPIQTAYASIMRLLDDRVELLQAENRTLETIAQAIFKSWFIDFDPVHAKAAGEQPEGMNAETAAMFPSEFDDSELGPIPKGWAIDTVGNVIDTVSGTTPSTRNPEFWQPDEYWWVTPKDLSGLSSPILLETERRISEAGLARISSGLLPRGTLLMSSRAPIGYLAIAQVPTAINQGFIGILPGGTLTPEYMLFWCRLNMETIIQHANGSTFLEISRSSFRRIQIAVPPAPLVSKFTEIAGLLLQRIAENERYAKTLAELRDTLLPRLISGKLRIPEAEELVEEAVS